MVEYCANWAKNYPIVSIEDGMAEDDWAGWKLLTERLGKRVQLVGDDLFVTNTAILKEGIDKGIANSILVKVNQIGTLSESLAAITMAKQAKYTAIGSHRQIQSAHPHRRGAGCGGELSGPQGRLQFDLIATCCRPPLALKWRESGGGIPPT